MNFSSSSQEPFMTISELIPFFCNNKIITDFTNLINNKLYSALRDEIKKRAGNKNHEQFSPITIDEIKKIMEDKQINLHDVFIGYDLGDVEKIEDSMLRNIVKYINALSNDSLISDDNIKGAEIVEQNAKLSGIDRGHAGMFNIIALLGAEDSKVLANSEISALKNIVERYFSSMEKVQAAMKLFNADRFLSEILHVIHASLPQQQVNISDWMVDGKRNPNFVIALTNTPGNIDSRALYSDLLVSAKNIIAATGNPGFTEEECRQVHAALVNECLKMPNIIGGTIDGVISKQDSSHNIVRWAKDFKVHNRVLFEENIDISKISSFCEKLIYTVKTRGENFFAPTASKTSKEQTDLLVNKLEGIKEEIINKLTENQNKAQEKDMIYQARKINMKQTSMDLMQ